MATVGSSSAYAVRLCPSCGDPTAPVAPPPPSDKSSVDRHYCRTKKVLWPELVLWLSMAPRDDYPAHRLLYGRRR
jgi:hypothetical protein